MTRQSTMPSLVLCAIAVTIAAAAGMHTMRAATPRNSQPVVLRPSEIKWDTRPDGVRAGILYGDPAQPGPFVLRLDYPAGYRKEPHTHPNDAYVTVLEGRYFRGYGDTFDESVAVELIPGTFSVNPAGVSHYEWTTERAVLQVHAVGPWATTYIDEHAPEGSR